MDVLHILDVLDGLEAQIPGETDTIRAPRKRKTYKKRLDPFLLDESEFRKKYRFKKSTARFIIDLVKDDISTGRKKGNRISAETQLLASLRYWGRGEIQDDASDLHGLSQPSLSRAGRFIKMPKTLAEQEAIMIEFEAKFGMPQIVGLIDCTHIRIKKVGGAHGERYINRKGHPSFNVQVICDSSLKISDIAASWWGSAHDSRIFSESEICRRFESGEFHGVLLGDSGYPCTQYLFTPILNTRTTKEIAYDRKHVRTRNCVERCFGVLKARFQCLLRGLRCSLETAKATIVALAVLHNIALMHNDELIAESDPVPDDVVPTTPATDRVNGALARSMYIDRNF